MYWRLLSVLIVLFAFLTIPASSQSDSQALSQVPGMLSYIGTDYNVYSYSFSDIQSYQLTEDANRLRRYQWPTWSVDGRLAYFCCDLSFASTLDTAAYISPDGQQSGTKVFDGRGETIIYAYWSPRSCADESNCLDLAMLVNNVLDGGLFVEVLRDEDSGFTSNSIGSGQPFYISWSPNGSQLAFHRNNRNIEVYDVNSGEVIRTLPQPSSGLFQAPAWSPVDDRILFGAANDENSLTNLSIASLSETIQLVPELDGTISFSWSPDGNYIAYRVLRDGQFGSLFVVDAISGEIVSRSSTNGVIAFFWSPNSEKIAYITLASSSGFASAAVDIAYAQAQNGLEWNTLSISNSLNRSYTTFIPTSEMIYLLLYFDQFAQSHRIWSPDSSHIVYTEFGDDQQPVISVLNVTQADTVPFTLENGLLAIWSFQ